MVCSFFFLIEVLNSLEQGLKETWFLPPRWVLLSQWVGAVRLHNAFGDALLLQQFGAYFPSPQCIYPISSVDKTMQTEGGSGKILTWYGDSKEQASGGNSLKGERLFSMLLCVLYSLSTECTLTTLLAERYSCISTEMAFDWEAFWNRQAKNGIRTPVGCCKHTVLCVLQSLEKSALKTACRSSKLGRAPCVESAFLCSVVVCIQNSHTKCEAGILKAEVSGWSQLCKSEMNTKCRSRSVLKVCRFFSYVSDLHLLEHQM